MDEIFLFCCCNNLKASLLHYISNMWQNLILLHTLSDFILQVLIYSIPKHHQTIKDPDSWSCVLPSPSVNHIERKNGDIACLLAWIQLVSTWVCWLFNVKVTFQVEARVRWNCGDHIRSNQHPLTDLRSDQSGLFT